MRTPEWKRSVSIGTNRKVSEMSSLLVVTGLGVVILINLSIGLIGYRVALGHIKRMAEIEPPETCTIFSQEPDPRGDQPLTPEDIDKIEEWNK